MAKEFPRHFSTVEEKLKEAGFFLGQMKNVHDDFFIMRCHFSAFVSAARSVTLALIKTMSSYSGFQTWYEAAIHPIKNDPLAKYLLERRNEALHEGETRIGVGTYDRGTGKLLFYFSDPNPTGDLYGIEEDVVTASEKYFKQLAELIESCRIQFPERTNPDWPFNENALEKSSLSIEDLEESLGFPRGYTEGIPLVERLRLLKDSTPPIVAAKLMRRIRPFVD